ncbi:hypothetical protein [Parasphingopyxis sp.]|uniref:hypothetical protein n=1 Tax=Parasphingopyxis sp. TaxID=1920299 RepID=UPI0026340529|nr:hypothetical protein [Parasphingopyxis sp.]
MTFLYQQLLSWDPEQESHEEIELKFTFRREFWRYFGDRVDSATSERIHAKARQFLAMLEDSRPDYRDLVREIIFDALFRLPRFHPAEHGLEGEELGYVRSVLDELEDDIVRHGETGLSHIIRGALRVAVGEHESGYRHFGQARLKLPEEHHSQHHAGVMTVYDPLTIDERRGRKRGGIISEPVLVAETGQGAPQNPAFFSTMDPVFFICFARRYLVSLLSSNPGHAVVMSVLDASPDFLEWAAARVREWAPEESAVFLFSQTVHVSDKKPVFASARFLSAAAIAAHIDRDLLILDADMEAWRPMKKFDQLFGKAEIGLNVNQGYPGHLPWRKINASQLYFDHGSEFAHMFLDKANRYFLAAYDEEKSTNWWIDQNALAAAFFAFSQDEFYSVSPKDRRLADLCYGKWTQIRQQKYRLREGVATRRDMIAEACTLYDRGDWDRFDAMAGRTIAG